MDGKKVATILGVGTGLAGIVYLATKAKAVEPEKPSENMANLYGVVKDKVTGQGVIGAVVSLNGLQVYSGDDGYYVFLDVDPGEYTFTVEKEGYNTMDTQSIILSAGQNTLQVALVPEYAPVAHINGEVRDANNEYPLAGTEVNLDGDIKVTDSMGLYSFFDLTPGEYTIMFSKSGYETASFTLVFNP
jgi:hypothetical protein